MAVVVVTAVALWSAAAVGLRDIAVFAAYQLAFVAVPGWLLYRVLAPEDSAARTLIFGWTLGYAIEISAYLIASEVGARAVFPFYPLLALPLAVVVGRRGLVRIGVREPIERGPTWTAAAVGVVTLSYLALTYFAKTPLPWRVPKVTYNTDLPYHLSLAAEALHHWPMTDPNVSGTGLYYHVWAHLDLAATSQVTGLPLPLLLFRFALVPLTLLFLAQLVLAGRVFTGRASVGVVAGALLLLVGEVDVQPWYSFPFFGVFFTNIWLSPTFLLGLVFFVPAIVLIKERMSSAESVRAEWGRWLLIVFFLVACGGAKATILPVVLVALALTIGARWWTSRQIGANALVALSSVTIVFLLYYVAIYSHARLGLTFNPLGTFGDMGWVKDLRSSIGDAAGWPLGTVLGTLGLFGPQLAGLPALVAIRGRDLDDGRILLIALFLAGLGPFFLLHQAGNSQLFFSHYGLVAAALLAAEGIVLLCKPWPRRGAVRAAAAIAVATAAAIVLVVYGIAANIYVGTPGSVLYAYERKTFILLVLAGIFVLLWRWSSPSGRRAPLIATVFTGTPALFVELWRLHWNPNMANAGYELVATLLVFAAIAALVAPGPRRRELALLLVVSAVAVGALDVPLDQGPDAITRLEAGRPFFNAGETGLNRGLYDGLNWIRKNTSDDSVLAVNNHTERNGGITLPAFMYYGAFSERRVFLEGWLFTAKEWDVAGDHLSSKKIPFPTRLRLNRAVFEHADAGALRVLVRDYGVRYLVDDRLQGMASPALGRLGRVVYANPSVVVYAVGRGQVHA